jgi:hypothetical protein
MLYISTNIMFGDAIALLSERDVKSPHDEIVSALLDGTVVASGLIGFRDGKLNAHWGEVPSVWWRHLNDPIEDNAAFFDQVETDPPTPWRVERIEIPRASIDGIWRKASKKKSSRGRGRPRGSGSIASDGRLVQRALEMMETGSARPARDAARKLAPKAAGYGSTASKIDRLRRKIKAEEKTRAAQVGGKIEFLSNE